MSRVATRLSSWFKDDTLVTILLTDNGTKYTLSKKIVCSISDYFAKALDGDFREAHERTLKLPDCSEETFDAVLWFHLNSSLPWDIESGIYAQLLLMNLWLFADIYLVTHMKGEILATASEHLDCQAPCPHVLAELLVRVPEDSSMRALFVENATSCIIQGSYDEVERAELAKIDGFFKIMADGLAVGKDKWAIVDNVAQGQGSISRSPTSKSTLQTVFGALAPSTAAIVRSSNMPTGPIGPSAPDRATTQLAPSAKGLARHYARCPKHLP
ncbi:hypothetical protein KC343_g12843 [Hortaea werneckii]|uniref:BTB domain-containing protein n=1 Tax=Hortaea werneckii TaxID=91943 RepID=A0A3M7HFX2_HORWE|nr:hypothetical protein KC352_g23736 [Hortaea werneckii]KAI7572884.1 hypothetical protein KC317_g377 [Hortaea werneckii]KAI7602711.1 hypothetical protein KC346_g12244 [Hortaea werneckii]KAI7608058.1 hypothetical protein KC343_g12843 [Hortaea werneckii]KAI7643049.1 hypothetical protein KC319_g12807 [Hortaea werneckii]